MSRVLAEYICQYSIINSFFQRALLILIREPSYTKVWFLSGTSYTCICRCKFAIQSLNFPLVVSENLLRSHSIHWEFVLLRRIFTHTYNIKSSIKVGLWRELIETIAGNQNTSELVHPVLEYILVVFHPHTSLSAHRFCFR